MAATQRSPRGCRGRLLARRSGVPAASGPQARAARSATSSPRTRRSPSSSRSSGHGTTSIRSSSSGSAPGASESPVARYSQTRSSVNPGAGVEREQLLPARGLLADLLGQLALAGLERRLARHVELAGRDLERRRLPGRLARLARQPHVLVVERQHADRARVPDLLARHLASPSAMAVAARRRPARSCPPTATSLARRDSICAARSADASPRSRPAPRSTSAIATSSIPSSASTLTRSVGSWLRSVPLARLRHGEARGLERVRVRAAAGGDRPRLVAAGAQRALGERRPAARDGARRGSRRTSRSTVTSRSHSTGVGGVLAGGRPSRSRPPRRARVRCSAPRPRSGSARGRRWRRVPPSIVPTFAVVSGSRRPSRIAAIARAAASDRAAAVLGPDPGVGGAAVELRDDPVVGGRGDDDLADRRGVVEHVAEPAAQQADVERLRPAERDLLADREQQLDPDRGRLTRGRAAAARARASPRPRPCCRRRGSPRSRSPSRRRRTTGSTGAASGTVSRWAHSRMLCRAAARDRARAGCPQSDAERGAGAVLVDLEADRRRARR